MSRPFNRRRFLEIVALGAAAPAVGRADVTGSQIPEDRRSAALRLREEAAVAESAQPIPPQFANGDETALPRWTGAFTKGLPHTQLGEVEPGAYETLLAALATGKHADFESIARGSGRRLTNPQAAFAYQLEGGDSHRFTCPPPPRFSSPEGTMEMLELYWQALLRDVPFAEYSSTPLVQQAARDLGVTTETIFRGATYGDLNGPYISQFLWKPVPYLSGYLEQRYRTPAPGIDYLTSYSEWLQIQTGVPPWREPVFDPTPRYIRNGRDLAESVHYDFLYQFFLNAALILLNRVPETVLNKNPFLSPANPYKESKVQEGFVTCGPGEIVDWLGRVTTAALKAAWFQKWLVHRRLRPEEFGGRVHQTLARVAQYPVSSALLNSAAVQEINKRTGTYLLSQSYAEGSPVHPAYPSGHATVAGACATVLKAFFDENGLVPDCVMASADGLSLLPCHDFAPTVGQEINKLAFNVPMGRDWAGIHYRSDATAGLRLGEDVAISVMQDLVRTYNEDFAGFQFTRFDGTPVRIFADVAPARVTVATGVILNPTTANPGSSYSAVFTGANLGDETFFDIRFRGPGSNIDQEVFNWQTGRSARHTIPRGTAAGPWTFTGVRAHQQEGDHTGAFAPVSAVLTVAG